MFVELAFASALIQDRPTVYNLPEHFWTSMVISSQLPWRQRQHPVIEYPERARMNNVSGGRVAVECRVAAETGILSGCRVLAETPEGNDFGREVLSGVRNGRLDTSRWTSPTVRFSITFVAE